MISVRRALVWAANERRVYDGLHNQPVWRRSHARRMIPSIKRKDAKTGEPKVPTGRTGTTAALR